MVWFSISLFIIASLFLAIAINAENRWTGFEQLACVIAWVLTVIGLVVKYG